MIGLVRAASSLSRALVGVFAPASRLDGLKVMVLGLGDHVSREVVCTLSRQKAQVTVAGHAGEVELMRRDLELLGSVVALAPLEANDASEARLVADNFRALGQLPNVIVCCGPDADADADAYAAASVLVRALQPTLALHLIRTRPGAGASVAAGAVTARSLSALLDDPRLFDPARPLSTVRLGARLFHVRRREAVFAVRPAPDLGRRQTGRPAASPKAARRSRAAVQRANRDELMPLRPKPHPSLQQGDQA